MQESQSKVLDGAKCGYREPTLEYLPVCEQLLNVSVFEVWYSRPEYMVMCTNYDGDCIDLDIPQVTDRPRRGFKAATERLAFNESLTRQRNTS